jgi:hypothetical protein
MYCSTCGVAVTANLTYCNHCGAKVNGEKPDSLETTELRYNSFIMVMMVGLFVFGLVAIGCLIGIMKAILNFEFGPLVGFALLSFLVMVSLEGVLISRLFRRKRNPEESAQASLRPHITKELEAQSQLRFEPVSSVTDHTTRTLDSVRVREGSVHR